MIRRLVMLCGVAGYPQRGQAARATSERQSATTGPITEAGGSEEDTAGCVNWRNILKCRQQFAKDGREREVGGK